MKFTGRFRIYFNRAGAAPLVWCVMPSPENRGPWPRWELAVSEVRVDGAVAVRTVYRPKETPDDEDGKPSAWLECEGEICVDDSTAVITRAPIGGM